MAKDQKDQAVGDISYPIHLDEPVQPKDEAVSAQAAPAAFIGAVVSFDGTPAGGR